MKPRFTTIPTELGSLPVANGDQVFNSDVYDTWVNPEVQGNGGGIVADGPPWNNMPTSANITLPAISILVFARDQGDL